MLPKMFRYACLFLLVETLMSYDMPKGWLTGGTNPNQYEMGIDVGAGQDGKNAATIRSLSPAVPGYGTLVQRISSDNYKGKRLRYAGLLKTKNVNKWAGLQMKVVGKRINPITGKEEKYTISHDNMYNRFVSGTTNYTKYEIVLDIPDSASEIVYGARLAGSGQIWFEQIKLDIVGKDIPVTTSELREPTNLDFNK